MWSSLLIGWTCALRLRHLPYLGRPQDLSGLTVRRSIPRPQFIEKPQKKQITSEQKQRVKKLLLERISLRGITRSLGISMTWLQRFINKLYRSVPFELKVREVFDIFYTDLWESYCDVLPSDRHYPSTKKSGETTRIERLNNTLRHRYYFG